ncbi:methyltransferase domain-containing protein [Epibacterium sp. SM1979]|uniref:Methyltransferase domain-containing protein n=1 Tax=Tritonibacter litoralis TaxID=2662264 RepID=A0A843YM22_9RHOB|nr:class I SAM-dependent methyltransferase [Tritonibacter litoralis]MQQ10239.1 methyltransferase domain-containing protein [Tritonibacter litoralis]
MTDWTAGYTADLDYTHDFQRELTPSLLAFCATSQGVQHRLDGDTVTYCELGCGYGMAANLLAAANPHIEFYAMDFNPVHILGADKLAKDAALENLHFYEQSFDEFHNEPSLPEQFDVISLHGVYTWVSKDNQQLILDFITKRLKPGGLVYVSYNTLPGWAGAVPLSRMIGELIENGTGPIPDRIEAALEFCEMLQASGAKYFVDNPGLEKRLTKMRKMPKNYLAHEYMNSSWAPMHFTDMAADMSQAKMSYLGSANPMDHLDDLNFQPDQIAMLDKEYDPVRRENLRDILVNEQFRTDIFVRGRQPLTERGAVGAWFHTPFALTRPFTGELPSIRWRLGEVPLEMHQVEPILRTLSQGPATVKELLDKGVFGEMTWGRITHLLTSLAGASHITPCLPLEGLEAREVTCRRMNEAVCKRAEDSEVIHFLASPVTGGGIQVNRFEQLFLLAMSEGRQQPQDWAELVWMILAPQGQRVLKDGRQLETPEENLMELTAQAEAFATKRLPLLKKLGVPF